MSEEKRKKWRKEHLRTISTKLRKEEYLILLEYCRRWHTTPYSLLQEDIRATIRGETAAAE